MPVYVCVFMPVYVCMCPCLYVIYACVIHLWSCPRELVGDIYAPVCVYASVLMPVYALQVLGSTCQQFRARLLPVPRLLPSAFSKAGASVKEAGAKIKETVQKNHQQGVTAVYLHTCHHVASLETGCTLHVTTTVPPLQPPWDLASPTFAPSLPRPPCSRAILSSTVTVPGLVATPGF
ncbi:hypothetical protein GWK47_021864 [Chionoecetes opilio]|uniref:Uncharacterized protein n=1 Tax=Chionoecetes opilio TaxID=41210 RepID=A0A8J4XNB2_CHIOP|nr:hypothetical protein GWK47_021864 [Chionoecetes opilio]